MCQMCEEYEAELRRMEAARHVRAQRASGNSPVLAPHDDQRMPEVLMGIIEKIEVSDAVMRRLEADARLHRRTLAQEAAARLEGATVPQAAGDLTARARSLRASLPPQATDSLALLREDRAR